MMDAYDERVMSVGIHLSSEVHRFLARNRKKLDQLADMGVISRHDLDTLCRVQEHMEAVRIERLEAARS